MVYADETEYSYEFIRITPDAYNNALAGSDIIAHSSSALFQNVSAISFTRRGAEFALGYVHESFFDNLFTLNSIFSLHLGTAGIRSLIFFSRDEYADEARKERAYRGSLVSASYALLLDDLFFNMFIPVSIGGSFGFAHEVILGTSTSCIFADFSLTAELIFNRLFAACAVNNISFELDDSRLPLCFDAGIKHNFISISVFDFMYSIHYMLEEYKNDSLSAGINIVLYDNYALRGGYIYYIRGDDLSYRNAFHFGFGLHFDNLEIDASFRPHPSLNTRFDVMLRYHIYTSFIKLSEDTIKRLPLSRLIKETQEALEYEELDYAFLLIKTGLLKDPGNVQLVRLFMEIDAIRDRKELDIEE
ncbi:hypothetical protein ACFL6D_01565 [Spirochaetota bacterium]